jgi:cellulose synthase (UDP-forming)
MRRVARTGDQRFRGSDRLRRAITVLALIAGLIYLAWRAADTGAGSQPLMFAVLWAGEAFGLLVFGSLAFLAWRVPASSRPEIGWRPTADVFVCTYDESPELLAATLVGCDRITYPHTTWVLDDGRRPEVETLAERFGANYLTRPTREHAKAGNINHALARTRGQVVLVLDADHVPQPDILDATVGYFDDPSVALVQTPHDFANLDSFQHFDTGRHDQSLFFDVIMPGKDRHNGVYWCGSAAVILRHALEGIGGIATETVVEGFHTSIRLHGQGWRTRYHDETLVQGLAPDDLGSFLAQRRRWADGSLTVLRTPENPLVAHGLSPRQRLSYLSSLLGYFVPFQRLAMLAVLVAMLVTARLPLHASGFQLAALWLPWMGLSVAASSLLRRGEASRWDVTYSTLLTTEVFVRAAAVVARPFRSPSPVPPATRSDQEGWSAVRRLPLIALLCVVAAGAVLARGLALAGLVPLPPLHGLAATVGLVLALWELALMSATLRRVAHRHQARRRYRVPMEVAGVLDGALVRVTDLTAGGAGIVGSSALVVGSEVGLVVELPSIGGGTRTVRVRFTVGSCRPARGRGWRMGGTLTPETEADGEALIEHCHVGAARTRLARSGRVVPAPDSGPRGTGTPVAVEESLSTPA